MIVLSLVMLCEPCWAMGNKAKQVQQTANDLGNNDAVQQAAGDLGEGIAKQGGKLIDQGYGYINNGINNSKTQQIVKTGTNIAAGGKILEWTGKGAPHVGWIATSAGTASTGDYSGAAIQAVNGGTRTVVVGAMGLRREHLPLARLVRWPAVRAGLWGPVRGLLSDVALLC